MGLLGGLALGAGLLFLIVQMDSSIKSVEDAEALLGVSVLAAVPEYAFQPLGKKATGFAWKKRLAFVTDFLGRGKVAPAPPDLKHSPVLNDPQSPAAEAFRTLRASIQTAQDDAKNSFILVTSPLPDEGKSFCSLNLAVVLAHSGQRTLLVDAQLRTPVLEERIFSTRGHRGLTDFLRGTANFSSVIRSTTIPHLDVVCAGSFVANLGEILSPLRFHEFLTEAKPHYDRVIFDSAPINPVSDTLCFARYFQVICLVLRAGKTPRAAAERALELLNRTGVSPSGLIMNFTPREFMADDWKHDGSLYSETGDLDFPKTCPSCGRIYEDFDDYVTRTLSPSSNGSSSPQVSDAMRSVQFARICQCGTPVIVASDNRRDSTEEGQRRREIFSELLNRVKQAGLSHEEGRAKLLLTLKIWRNETFNESHQDNSEAGVRRRQLFTQMLEYLTKSGLSQEEARVRLLGAIQIWRDAP